jgi:hypothetical protein
MVPKMKSESIGDGLTKADIAWMGEPNELVDGIPSKPAKSKSRTRRKPIRDRHSIPDGET